MRQPHCPLPFRMRSCYGKLPNWIIPTVAQAEDFRDSGDRLAMRYAAKTAAFAIREAHQGERFALLRELDALCGGAS